MEVRPRAPSPEPRAPSRSRLEHRVDTARTSLLHGTPIRPRLNEHSFSLEVPMPPSAAARRARVPDTGADKRAAILKAATRTFARRGYFQSQVADIARAAGIAAGTVYL